MINTSNITDQDIQKIVEREKTIIARHNKIVGRLLSTGMGLQKATGIAKFFTYHRN